jgi:hypothetical protein
MLCRVLSCLRTYLRCHLASITRFGSGRRVEIVANLRRGSHRAAVSDFMHGLQRGVSLNDKRHRSVSYTLTLVMSYTSVRGEALLLHK